MNCHCYLSRKHSYRWSRGLFSTYQYVESLSTKNLGTIERSVTRSSKMAMSTGFIRLARFQTARVPYKNKSINVGLKSKKLCRKHINTSFKHVHLELVTRYGETRVLPSSLLLVDCGELALFLNSNLRRGIFGFLYCIQPKHWCTICTYYNNKHGRSIKLNTGPNKALPY
jgi:hypothetical protein